MYYWLILLPCIYANVYVDWITALCPPTGNIIPNNDSDYLSLSYWINTKHFLSAPILGLSHFSDYSVLDIFPTAYPRKDYYVEGTLIPGILTPPMQNIDVPAPPEPNDKLNSLLKLRTLTGLNCDNTNFQFIRRCGKCYHASTCMYFKLWDCAYKKGDFKCSRKRSSKANTNAYNVNFVYYCKSKRLAYGPADTTNILYANPISPSATYKLQAIQTNNCTDYAFKLTNQPLSNQFVPNTPKFFIFDFQCSCSQQCLYYLYANVYVVVTDDIVEYDRLGFTKFNLESHIAYLNAEKEKSESNNYGFIYLPQTNATFAFNHWHAYSFKLKLKIVTYGYLGSYSSPNVYCVNYVPHSMSSSCTHSTTKNFIYTTDNGKFAYENGITYPDPIFITAEITSNPTINSTAVPEGYKWAGSFQPATLMPRKPTVEQHHIESCYTEEFTLATRVIAVPKLQPINHISCQHLCPGKSFKTLSRAKTINQACTIQELYSPIMQQCYEIVGDIRAMSGSTLKADQHYYSANNVTFETEDLFKGVDLTILKETLNVKARVTINEVSDRVKKFQKLFKLSDTEYVYSFPKQEEAAWALGLFKESLFNQDRDINFIAAFPWAAAWRFGRQINALSFATSTLVHTYQNLVKELNHNFDTITTTLKQQSEHIILNSKYINRLIQMFNQFTTNQNNNLLLISQHLSSVEYMTAKLSQFSAIRTNLQSFLLENSILSRLLQQRVLDCNNKLASCLDVPGLYLSHSYIKTNFQNMLVISYLKPKCENVEVEAYYCQNNVTYLAPFGCQFVDKQLQQSLTNATCEEPILLQGCQYDSPDLMLTTALFKPLSSITPSSIPLNLLNYSHLAPIELNEFKTNITDLINDIKPISTMSQFLNTSVGDWLEKVEEYAYQGSDWLFWLKVVGIVFATLLFLPIFISCCMLSFRIAAFNQKLK
nr:spike protein [Serpentovirales sp.]